MKFKYSYVYRVSINLISRQRSAYLALFIINVMLTLTLCSLLMQNKQSKQPPGLMFILYNEYFLSTFRTYPPSHFILHFVIYLSASVLKNDEGAATALCFIILIQSLIIKIVPKLYRHLPRLAINSEN